MSQARLDILLLGRPSVLLDGSPLPFRRRKTTALLVALACRLEPLGRSVAAGLLWPESPPERARQSLRQAIFDAGSLAGRPLIVDEAGYLRLAKDLVVETDCARFETLAKQGLGSLAKDAVTARRSLREASLLYRGEFLEGFYLSDAVDFEDWQLGEAHRLQILHEKVEEGLESLGNGLAERGRLGLRQIPEPKTSLVGREKVLEEIRVRLGAGRLLCLTGPGGIGKTRLAIEAAGRARKGYADGAAFVDLAPCARDSDVAPAIALSLGLRLGRGGMDDLAGGLREGRLLLVLDNCEHVIEGAAEAADWIGRSCPRLALLATSRERLGVPGEVLMDIPPLSLPVEAGETGQADEVLMAEAPRLLIERCRSERPDWAPQAEELAHIGAICRRLDGLPLALELAAPRLASLGAAGLRQLLDARVSAPLDLLEGSVRGPRESHRALKALFDWSWETLGAEEAWVFPRLAVFRGSFSLEAALAVGGKGEAPLLGLVDKALVLSLPSGPGPRRFRLLETVKAYAYRRLEEEGKVESAKRAHLEFYSALALGQEIVLRELRSQGELQHASLEIDEFEAAMRYAIELPGLLPVAASMARALVSLFWLRSVMGRLGSLVREIEATAAWRIQGSCAADLAYAKGHCQAGDYDTMGAKESLEVAAALYHEAGNDLMEAYSLSHAGTGVDNWHAGDGLCLGPERALVIFRSIGYRPGMADAYLAIGKGLFFSRNDTAEAGKVFAEGHALVLEHGAIPVQAEYWTILAYLADFAHDAGNFAVFLEKSDSLATLIDDPTSLSDNALLRANRAYHRHDYAGGLAAARDYHRHLARLNRPLESAKALRLISTGLFLLGRTEEAFATEEEALGIARACGHIDEVGLHRNTLACMELGMGRAKKGLGIIEDLVAVARQEPDSIEVPRNVLRLARHYAAMGMVPEALAAYKEVISHPEADYIAKNAKIFMCPLEPLGPYPLAFLPRLRGILTMDYMYWSQVALGLGLRLLDEGETDLGLEVAIHALASRLSPPPIYMNFLDQEVFKRIAARLKERYCPGMEKALSEAMAFYDKDEAGFFSKAKDIVSRLELHYGAGGHASRA